MKLDDILENRFSLLHKVQVVHLLILPIKHCKSHQNRLANHKKPKKQPKNKTKHVTDSGGPSLENGPEDSSHTARLRTSFSLALD